MLSQRIARPRSLADLIFRAVLTATVLGAILWAHHAKAAFLPEKRYNPHELRWLESTETALALLNQQNEQQSEELKRLQRQVYNQDKELTALDRKVVGLIGTIEAINTALRAVGGAFGLQFLVAFMRFTGVKLPRPGAGGGGAA